MSKYFTVQAAQGDLLIRKVDTLPEGLTKAKAVNGKHIVAHSETGHHHTVLASRSEYMTGGDPMIAFLSVLPDAKEGDVPLGLQHERPYDTHEALSIPVGNYEIRRQRESTPEGWRRVED